MSDQSDPRPARHLLGTNLTLGEALRLLLLLCGPPWAFGALIILSPLASAPDTALGWILYLAAGPAAWGAFISAVADGHTLLGRPREPGAPRQPWWNVVRVEDRSVRSNIVGGDRIEAGGPVATRGSALADHDGIASVGDDTMIIKDVRGDVKVVHGDLYETPVGPQADAAALRRAYLHRVLEQTQTLQLSGVDPKTARDQTASTGLALAAVYTALMTQQTEQEERGRMSVPDREARRLSAVAVLDREPKLALLGIRAAASPPSSTLWRCAWPARGWITGTPTWRL